MKKFLRDKDSLGATPMMTYKKNAVFGTSIGGCCSLVARILMGTYINIILLGFYASPNYNV